MGPRIHNAVIHHQYGRFPGYPQKSVACQWPVWLLERYAQFKEALWERVEGIRSMLTHLERERGMHGR